MTCTTCLTLNPPGAPACVRCNTPLEGAASAGAGPAAAPGTAAAADPAGAPGMVAVPGPAAPAQDPTAGSKRIGPGLSAAVTAAAGSSRARAAAVQPPGYG